MKKLRKPDPRDGWYEIDPSSAQALLDRQIKNRPLSEADAARIARQIDDGQWEANGESIVLDQQGRLIDGQTRLRACILANRPIVCYVVHGVPAKAFDSFDQGKTRTLANIAAIMGVPNYALASAVAQWAIKYEIAWSMDHVRASNRDARLWLQKNAAELQTALEEMARLSPPRRRGGVRPLGIPSVIAFTYYMARRIDPAKAQEFYRGIAVGENLSAGSPILALRNRIAGMSGRADRDHQMAWFVKTWNAFHEGRKLQLIKHVTKQGGAGEGLPRFGEKDEDEEESGRGRSSTRATAAAAAAAAAARV